jgi:hypothetical protein
MENKSRKSKKGNVRITVDSVEDNRTKAKIKRHMSDINDKISAEDISNAKTNFTTEEINDAMASEESVEEVNNEVANESKIQSESGTKKLETQLDKKDLPKEIPTSYDILDRKDF